MGAAGPDAGLIGRRGVPGRESIPSSALTSDAPADLERWTVDEGRRRPTRLSPVSAG